MKSLNKQTPDSGPEIIANRNTSVCSTKLDPGSPLLGEQGTHFQHLDSLGQWLPNQGNQASKLPDKGQEWAIFQSLFSTSIFLDMGYDACIQTTLPFKSHPPTFPDLVALVPIYSWDVPVMLSIRMFSYKISSIYFNDKPAIHSWAKETTSSIIEHFLLTQTFQTPPFITSRNEEASANHTKLR